MNTGESYPFADRLIEYLVGNAITNEDEIADNIKRVQKVLNENSNEITYYGLWEDKIRPIVYNYMNNPDLKCNKSSMNHDILGFIDKDVEKNYVARHIVYIYDKDGNMVPVNKDKLKAQDSNGIYLQDKEGAQLHYYPWSELYIAEIQKKDSIMNVDIYKEAN